MALPELRDALQASERTGGFTAPMKQALEYLFGAGLDAALQSGTGITITWDESAGTFTFTGAPTSVGKHAVPIASGSMSPSASGGCAALATIASAANQPDIQTLDFDSTSNEYAQFAIPMPSSWNEGTITARFVFSHASSSGDVIWGLQAVALADGDDIATSYGTAQEVTKTSGASGKVRVTGETAAITVAGAPAAGELVQFRVYRNAVSGSDTLGVDARLHAVVLYLTTDAATDA